jgi:hypothetical protein
MSHAHLHKGTSMYLGSSGPIIAFALRALRCDGGGLRGANSSSGEGLLDLCVACSDAAVGSS